MGVETLKINITADNKSAIAAAQQTRKELEKAGLTVDGLTQKLAKLKDQLAQATDPRNVRILESSIKNVTTQITILGAQSAEATNKSVNGLTKMFSGLRTIAYIVPGIGIAGIFNLAFEAIGKAADELGLFNAKITDTQKQYQVLNDVNKETDKNAGKEIGNLKLLYAAATDHNLAMKDRLRAAQELKKEYPDILANFSAEKIAVGGAADAYKALTDRIIANARAAAVASKIGELEGQRLDAEANKKKINAVVDTQMKAAKGYNTGGEASEFVSADREKAILTFQRNKALKEQDAILKQIDATENLLMSTVSSKGIVDGLLGPDPVEKIHKTKKAFDELAEYMKVYYQMVGLRAGAVNSDTKDPTNLLGKPVTHINNDSKTGSGVFDKEIEGLNEKHINDQKQYNEQLKFTLEYTNLLGDAFYNAIVAGESLGDTLKNVFADLAKQIGKALIKALLFKAIGSAFGLVGSSKGFGEIFSNFLGIGKGFAKGGLSTGPQSGHMELLHGNEWVLKPSQLNGALDMARNAGRSSGSLYNGGQSQALPVPSLFMKGSDFWLMYQQSQRLNQRGY